MTEPSTTTNEMRNSERELVLADHIVPGGFFLTKPTRGERTPFVHGTDDHSAPYRHCCTYAGGGSTILTEVEQILDEAEVKVFVAVLYLGDRRVREALLRAVERLRGGVYVISALDDKSMEKAANEVDDSTSIDAQTEYRNFRSLTTHGIHVRGYRGLHAKFVVVDDRIALVSSANLVTRSFDQIGENGVIVTNKDDVDRLARLFACLWQESQFDMPPDPEDRPVEARTRGSANSTIRLTTPRGNGPIWTYPGGQALRQSDRYTIAGALHQLAEGAENDLILATFSIANMTHGFQGESAQPELLYDPVRRAIHRGVRVRMLLRGRNHIRSARLEAAAFAQAGVEIYADRLTHAKGGIADGRRGALFSANFLTDMGLTGGVEVGMRLDGTPALTEAMRYFEHVMREASMEFVHEPLLGDLAARLYAETFTPWPLPPVIELAINDTEWDKLRRQEGVVLWERSGDKPITLYAGRHSWLLREHEGWHWLEPNTSKRQRTRDLFERWLTAPGRPPEGICHGLCHATFVRLSAHLPET
jgi:phosphatidylserine/phosphatidylglycerophosphate/cardiolipin synthase-like enzyme